MNDEGSSDETVRTTVEMVGEYEEIAKILGGTDGRAAEVGPVADDLATIVAVVRETGGATKSQIAEEVASNVTAGFDADSVIHALRLLALYDLVTLDGNTWRPGTTLSDE